MVGPYMIESINVSPDGTPENLLWTVRDYRDKFPIAVHDTRGEAIIFALRHSEKEILDERV